MRPYPFPALSGHMSTMAVLAIPLGWRGLADTADGLGSVGDSLEVRFRRYEGAPKVLKRPPTPVTVSFVRDHRF
jgi:hypothetical protein